MAPEVEIQIVGGPGKYDIMTSLFSKNLESRKVLFEVEGLDPHKRISAIFVIAKVERKDGSAENWLIEGFRLTTYAPLSQPLTEVLVPFRGHFSTKTRKGRIVESPPR